MWHRKLVQMLRKEVKMKRKRMKEPTKIFWRRQPRQVHLKLVCLSTIRRKNIKIAIEIKIATRIEIKIVKRIVTGREIARVTRRKRDVVVRKMILRTNAIETMTALDVKRMSKGRNVTKEIRITVMNTRKIATEETKRGKKAARSVIVAIRRKIEADETEKRILIRGSEIVTIAKNGAMIA